MSRLCPGKEVSAASDDFRLTGEKGLVETVLQRWFSAALHNGAYTIHF
jgi:hypothetical protein